MFCENESLHSLFSIKSNIDEKLNYDKENVRKIIFKIPNGDNIS